MGDRPHVLEETWQKQQTVKDKIMNEKGKTITESIEQGTPMGAMLGGWTMNQAEVNRCIDSKRPKMFTCDAFDAYKKIVEHDRARPEHIVVMTNSDRVAVGKRCKAYKVVSAAAAKAMKFVKGFGIVFNDFNCVNVYGVEPMKKVMARAGSYFEVCVNLHGDFLEWRRFLRFVTCFLDEMCCMLGRSVIIDRIFFHERGGTVAIKFRFAKKSGSKADGKPSKKRR